MTTSGSVDQETAGPALRQAVARHLGGDLPGAVDAYRTHLAVAPDHAPTWSNLGLALKLLGDVDGAVDACRRAVALDGRNANALNNLGLALVDAHRLAEAIDVYRRAVAAAPDFHECWTNLGLALAAAAEPAAAATAFRRALEIAPTYAPALIHLVHQAQQHFAWTDLDTLVEGMRALARSDAGEVNPFVMLALTEGPEDLVEVTRNFGRRVVQSVAALPRPHRQVGDRARERLRIGYLSANFHNHAVAQLAVELFERHDRSRFEITAYSFGPDDGSPIRRRVERAFENFVDVRSESLVRTAQRIADDGIDILVDLMGYTQGARTGILALRPAPIQVAYLGYPGPMGAAFIDYSLVDRFTVPPDLERFFDEPLVVLPGSYQPNDSRREIAAETGQRHDHGLPEKGFVFCCFNQAFKITADVFGWWIGLLLDVPDSLLWLLAFNQDARARLREEVAACGIAPHRLVFAEKLPLAEHLARLRHADIFLDTWPYGAHTTASDALWAGVPVLTWPGRTFASRVAGSLLRDLGLDELIAASPDAYVEKARHLAADATAMAALKARVRQARDAGDLFSGEAAARKLEAAFLAMWKRRADGLPPATIDLSQPKV
ncbi:MAG TPA: tetratricopeptide repeat protein [Methylomirabilota bacterium]|nr:tetratricopeptide repeat protein [Methylomirabilota bacterium]